MDSRREGCVVRDACYKTYTVMYNKMLENNLVLEFTKYILILNYLYK
jgi:hypothetical protein